MNMYLYDTAYLVFNFTTEVKLQVEYERRNAKRKEEKRSEKKESKAETENTIA